MDSTSDTERETVSERVRAFKKRFRQMAADVEAIEDAHAELQRHRAERFNVFRLLGVARDEVRTHSAVLADLLHPTGRHGQGTLFLRRFLHTCQGARSVNAESEFPVSAGDIGSNRWHVEKERHVAGAGRLDVVARCPAQGALMVIENKIRPGDDTAQLVRYSRWLQSQTLYPDRALVYLTPKGGRPPSSKGVSYYRLSYRKDIKTWLSGALAEVKAPQVRMVLRQYLAVVRSL